ncbi:MAG TPA: DUF2911 domain-containing protein [Bryobacteraceae bacterium]|nr:DUF2911 domain-containing protein [Bryobacteraceae bacterium]
MKILLTSAFLVATAALILAQGPKKFNRTTDNPKVEAKEIAARINGKTINISYSAPSVRGRKIFADGGLLGKGGSGFVGNSTIWRAGADDATCMHTDAPLDINGLAVPAGDYSLWVDVDSGKWQLIINREFGQWGESYNQAQDLGRVPMTMGKTPALVEQYKMTLTQAGGNRGRLTLEWENTMASVNIAVK